MKQLEELQESSVLEVESSSKNQTRNFSKTAPKNQASSEEASAEFWQAIKTVISLQNQAPPLQPISREGNLALAFSQERLWFFNQLNPESSAHNIPVALRFSGALNVSALEQSLNKVLQRHETLRTTFKAVNGQPVQQISPSITVTLPIVDLRRLPPEQREIQALQFAAEEVQHPFHLNQEPLLRATLLQLSEQEHILLLVIHQIVFDGWSEGVLFQELAAFYEAVLTGKPSPLSELPIQYADFAHWQRQSLQGEFLETLLSYWQHQLRDGLPAHQLIANRPHPIVPTRRSARQTLVLSKELTRKLKALSLQEGATLFTTLLSAFKVLLYRYTDQDNLFVCSPTANRNRSQTKPLIGYFVNLLLLRTNLSGNPTFRELLSRVRQVVSGAYAHQDLPIQQVINSLNLVNTPLSQVMFTLQNMPRQLPQIPDLTVSAVPIDNGTADFDLSLSMEEEGEHLSGVWKYNTDLFDDISISQMQRHFLTLLETIVAYPEQELTSLLPNLVNSWAPPEEVTELEASHASGYAPPKNTLELQLTQIWEKLFGIHPIGVQDNFFALGGHSLLAVNLFAQIQETFGKNLPLTTLFQAGTIEQLAKILHKQGYSVPWSSLVPMQPKGSKPPLFLIHACAGKVFFYGDLVRHLDPEQPIYGLQAPGIDGKQAFPTTIEEMVSLYIKEIRAIQPEGPYYIGGLHIGAFITFEIARQLELQGQKVALLAVLDTKTQDFSRWSWVSRHWNNLLRIGPRYFLELLKGRFRWINFGVTRKFQKITHNSGSNSSSAPKDWLYVRAHETFSGAMKNYVPQVYPGRVSIFRAIQQPLGQSYDLGWGRLAGGGFEIYEVPGNHYSFYKEPHVKILAEKLTACLNEAQGNDLAPNLSSKLHVPLISVLK